MNNIDNILELLKKVASVSLRFRKNETTEVAQNFLKLTKLFEETSSENREVIKSHRKETRSIFGYSRMAAEHAINLLSIDWLRAGLISHIMSGVDWDYTLNIRYLILLNHAAVKMNISIIEVFKEIENMADIETQKIMKATLRDDQPLSVINGEAIEEVEIGGQTQFRPIL